MRPALLESPPKIRVTGRWYVINTRSYPRVSTVLDIIHEEGLEKWREDVGDEEADRISQESSDLGQRVHAECEKLARQRMCGGSVELDEDLTPYSSAFSAWLDEDVDEVLFSEETVWAVDPVFAGTIDLVIRRKNGNIAVVDIKTSKKIRTKYRLQTTAYVEALAQRHGIQADERGILHLPSNRKGYLKYKPIASPYDDDWQAFTAALFLHQYVYFYRRDYMV